MSGKNKSAVAEAYKARLKHETEGVWCDLVVGSVKIKAATGRNKEFIRLAKGMSGGKVEDEIFNDVVRVLAESIVLDWKGFDVDYTPEAFIDLCIELKDCGFADDVFALARDQDMFNAVAVASAAKN